MNLTLGDTRESMRLTCDSDNRSTVEPCGVVSIGEGQTMNRWLKCCVVQGMFTNERIIIVHIRGNGSIEEFVPEDEVSGEGVDGRVKVRLFHQDERPWVVLPTPYGKTIPIEEDQLIPV